MCFSVILGAVQNFSRALTDNFLHENAFDYQVIFNVKDHPKETLELLI